MERSVVFTLWTSGSLCCEGRHNPAYLYLESHLTYSKNKKEASSLRHNVKDYLSHCTVAAKRDDDQGNAYKNKTFNWGLVLQF